MILKLRAFDRGVVRIVTNLLLLIIMIPGYVSLASNRSPYIETFYYLVGIPCRKETFGPEHAICEGYGFCTTDTIGMRADEGYLCPNGAAVYHQAILGGTVGGPQLSSTGTSYDLLTTRVVHLKSFFSSCEFLATNPFEQTYQDHCTIIDPNTDPNGGNGGDYGGNGPTNNWTDGDGVPRYCYSTCTQNCFRYCDEIDEYGGPGSCTHYSDWECGEANCTVSCF